MLTLTHWTLNGFSVFTQVPSLQLSHADKRILARRRAVPAGLSVPAGRMTNSKWHMRPASRRVKCALAFRIFFPLVFYLAHRPRSASVSAGVPPACDHRVTKSDSRGATAESVCVCVCMLLVVLALSGLVCGVVGVAVRGAWWLDRVWCVVRLFVVGVCVVRMFVVCRACGWRVVVCRAPSLLGVEYRR